MNLKGNEKKLRVILTGAFVMVYAVSMFLATWMAQKEAVRSFENAAAAAAQDIEDGLKTEWKYQKTREAELNADGYDLGIANSDGINGTEAKQRAVMRRILSSELSESGTEHMLISAALYDETGRLAAQSGNVLEAYKGEYYGRVNWDLSDYLSMEELETLAGFKVHNIELEKSIEEASDAEAADDAGAAEMEVAGADTADTDMADAPENPEELWYKVYAVMSSDENELAEIYVTQESFNSGAGSAISPAETVWTWKNPDVTADESDRRWAKKDPYADAGMLNLYLPGIWDGEKTWKEWQESEYLNAFPEQADIREMYRTEGASILKNEGLADWKYAVTIEDQEDPAVYTLCLRAETHPWLAAADQLKLIYLWGAVLTGICAAAVLTVIEKNWKEKKLLEARRRDFVNAMAHEMKTPLAVIRGFAENLEENVKEEKRMYYLQQIVGQTEKMDDIVKELVYISELDDENFCVSKESVSVREILEAEEDRLSSMIEAKRVSLKIQMEEDLVIGGEKRLLEKAFGSLLTNAVEYNRDEGRVTVTLEKNRCVIENTGEKIPEEELPRVCELFYTGSRGKDAEEKHLGIGLSLAERIFQAHGMTMKVENTEEGVRVVVQGAAI